MFGSQQIQALKAARPPGGFDGNAVNNLSMIDGATESNLARAIQAIRNATSPVLLASGISIDAVIKKLNEQITMLEHLKYPSSQFSTKAYDHMINGVTYHVFDVIKKFPAPAVNPEIFNLEIGSKAFLIRQLSIISGAVVMIQSMQKLSRKEKDDLFGVGKELDLNKFWSAIGNRLIVAFDQAKREEKSLQELNVAYQASESDKTNKIKLEAFEEKLQEFKETTDYKTNLDACVETLSFRIHESGFVAKNHTDLMNQIRNAERYFVADLNKQKVLVNEDQELNVTQVDIPSLNSLTGEQKMELVGVHQDPPSAIFSGLYPFEIQWLKDNVPTKVDADWSKYESLFISSSMQHLPGIKNSRLHYLFIQDQLVSVGAKTAMLVPYESTKENWNNLGQENIRQLGSQLKRLAESRYQAHKALWGNLLPDDKPIVLVNSIMSSNYIDAGFVAAEKVAFNLMQDEMNKKGEIQFIYGNDTFNFARLLGHGNTNHKKVLVEKADNFIKKVGENVKTDDQQESYNLIKSSKSELEKSNKKFLHPQFRHRNRAAFRAAYAAILVESMGGIVSVNCKSGKDRTGFDEIYKDAMRVYYHTHNHRLPSYDDIGKDRDDFVNIFAKIFRDLKAQESAALNTPGSFGLKDEYGYKKLVSLESVLCKDIAKALNVDYAQSNVRAGWNKPPKFKACESEQNTLNKKISKANPAETWQDRFAKIRKLYPDGLPKIPVFEKMVALEENYKKSSDKDAVAVTARDITEEIDQFILNDLTFEYLHNQVKYSPHSAYVASRVRQVLAEQPKDWLSQLNSLNCSQKPEDIDRIKQAMKHPLTYHPAPQDDKVLRSRQFEDQHPRYFNLLKNLEPSLSTPGHKDSGMFAHHDEAQYIVNPVSKQSEDGAIVAKLNGKTPYASFIVRMPETTDKMKLISKELPTIQDAKIKQEIAKCLVEVERERIESGSTLSQKARLVDLLRTSGMADGDAEASKLIAAYEKACTQPCGNGVPVPTFDYMQIANKGIEDILTRYGRDKKIIIHAQADPILAQAYVLLLEAKKLSYDFADNKRLNYVPEEAAIKYAGSLSNFFAQAKLNEDNTALLKHQKPKVEYLKQIKDHPRIATQGEKIDSDIKAQFKVTGRPIPPRATKLPAPVPTPILGSGP